MRWTTFKGNRDLSNRYHSCLLMDIAEMRETLADLEIQLRGRGHLQQLILEPNGLAD